jgi:2TM domain
MTPPTPVAAHDHDRQEARHRLERRRKFWADLVAYLVINAFIIVIWALSDHDSFWPGWVLGGWGALLLLDAWNAFFRAPITEADIDRELDRRRR